jgi:hypothetical protein
VKKALTSKRGDPAGQEKQDIVQRYVGDSSGPLATERIVRVLCEIQHSGPEQPASWQQTRLRLLSAARSAASRARRVLRPNKSLLAYMVQKFPELEIEELRQVLEKISRARGKPLSISVAPHPQLSSCFVLRREEPAAAVA